MDALEGDGSRGLLFLIVHVEKRDVNDLEAVQALECNMQLCVVCICLGP